MLTFRVNPNSQGIPVVEIQGPEFTMGYATCEFEDQYVATSRMRCYGETEPDTFFLAGIIRDYLIENGYLEV